MPTNSAEHHVLRDEQRNEQSRSSATPLGTPARLAALDALERELQDFLKNHTAQTAKVAA